MPRDIPARLPCGVTRVSFEEVSGAVPVAVRRCRRRHQPWERAREFGGRSQLWRHSQKVCRFLALPGPPLFGCVNVVWKYFDGTTD